MSPVSQAIRIDRTRDDASWENEKSYRLPWTNDPFYEPERILEKQEARFASHPDNKEIDPADWDQLDFLAAFGVVLLIIGFVLTFVPNLRPGGILFPIGGILMAVAAYGAKRKDQDED